MVENNIIFRMSTSYRTLLIDKHKFYVQQSKARLLDQFTDEAIEQEADLTADEFWNRKICEPCDPDHHAPKYFAEDACQEGVWRYQLLIDLRDTTRMNIIAGFMNKWEKSLKQWLVDELRHWDHMDGLEKRIWTATSDMLFDLLNGLGWSLGSAEFFPALDASRLVVNVHKHGDGPSLTKLADLYPGYLESPLQAALGKESLAKFKLPAMWGRPSHKYLNVTDANLDAFSEAIVQFWSDFPENISDIRRSNLPNWFVKYLA